jgi:hypothetical protein
VKDCGVAVTMPQGQSRAPHLSIGRLVNVGTVPGFPPDLGSLLRRGGLARRPPMALARGGGPVIVRAGESPCTWRRGPAGSCKRGTAMTGGAGEVW